MNHLRPPRSARVYNFLDLVLLGGALFVCVVFFLPSVSVSTAESSRSFGSVPVAVIDREPPFYLWGERVRCADRTSETPERIWVYERVAAAREYMNGRWIDYQISVSEDFAIADPVRFWTVYVGLKCGGPFYWDAGAYVAVDRISGEVSEGVWEVVAGADVQWRRESGEWVEYRNRWN